MKLDSISKTIARALAGAGLNTRSDAMKNVTATIERALAAAGLAPSPSAGAAAGPAANTPSFRAPPPAPASWRPSPHSPASASASDVGQFLSLRHATGALARDYKLYVPSTYAGEPMPLVVMLHGCKQDPADFATGTRMNQFAEREGFLVAYPAQTARHNGSNCWNWFEAAQQHRGGEEPSLIAGIVGEIRNSHAIDGGRIFVAGLSAGAAMAVILGATHPELFAGVGAHSGLPLGAARDMPSAFAAMRGGKGAASVDARRRAVPTIVFHGDADKTVSPANGDAIVEQSVRAFAQVSTTLQARARPTWASQGRRYSVTDFVDVAGQRQVEEWVVHGGGHNWFGGNPAGTFTDPAGPDASADMVRFFLALAPAR